VLRKGMTIGAHTPHAEIKVHGYTRRERRRRNRGRNPSH
jgi:hypothetical protein